MLSVFLILFGMYYNLSHLDDALDPGHTTPLLENTPTIGLIIALFIPIILRRYIWLAIMIGLLAIYYAWIYFAK